MKSDNRIAVTSCTLMFLMAVLRVPVGCALDGGDQGVSGETLAGSALNGGS